MLNDSAWSGSGSFRGPSVDTWNHHHGYEEDPLRYYGRPRDRSASSWQWGNRQRRRQVLANFAKYSSMHGIHYICPQAGHRLSWFKRAFYSVFFVGCVLMMCGSLAVLLQESLGAESVYISSTSKDGVSGREEDPHFPRHPRITLCRRPGYLTVTNASDQELLEYAFLSLGFPFFPLTPEERTLLIEIIIRLRIQLPLGDDASALYRKLNLLKERYDLMKEEASPDFNLTALITNYSVRCEQIFLRCITFLIHFNCCDLFQPVLTPLGMCYSVLVEDALSVLPTSVHDGELSIIFDLRAAPKLDKAVDIGYEIHLSDPRNKEVAFNRAGQSLMNGVSTLLKTKLIKTSRLALYTAWHGRSHRCPTLAPHLDILEYGDRFFKAACEKRYMDALMRDHCHCRYLTDQSKTTLRECDPSDVYGCFLENALTDNLSGMARECVHPCLEYHYESAASFIQIGSDNISRLIFMYDGTQYSFHEYRTTTISSLLSQIGGALGLYLGASVITALELVTFAVAWLWYRFLPHRQRRGRRTTSTASTVGTGSSVHRGRKGLKEKATRRDDLGLYIY